MDIVIKWLMSLPMWLQIFIVISIIASALGLVAGVIYWIIVKMDKIKILGAEAEDLDSKTNEAKK